MPVIMAYLPLNYNAIQLVYFTFLFITYLFGSYKVPWLYCVNFLVFVLPKNITGSHTEQGRS